MCLATIAWLCYNDNMNRQDYQRQHYLKNREKYRQSNITNRARAKTFVNSLKIAPCMDCKGTFPPVAMDFDHRDPKDKILGVAQAANQGWGVTRIQTEIDKCDLVCANCHRIRTYV